MPKNTYTASMKNDRKTYWMPKYVPLGNNSPAFNGLSNVLDTVTLSRKPRRQAAMAITAKPPANTSAAVRNNVSTYFYNSRSYKQDIDPVPRHAVCIPTNILKDLPMKGCIHLDRCTLHFAEARRRISTSSGAEG